jgi:catechol-2,3-dioxygenase
MPVPVGKSVHDLRRANQALAASGIVMRMSLDHRVSQGIYISDPDGNLIDARPRRSDLARVLTPHARHAA